MQAHARSFSTSDVLRMMKAFNTAATDLRGGWQPSLSLELALAEVLDAPAESVPQIAAFHAKPQPTAVSQTESLPKTQANLAALLNSVRMIDVQGKTLILGLASDVLVSKIDKPDQIEIIQKLIKDEFGVDVNVRCMVTTAKGKIPPNVSQDGMVAAAIQHGGEIVDMQD